MSEFDPNQPPPQGPPPAPGSTPTQPEKNLFRRPGFWVTLGVVAVVALGISAVNDYNGAMAKSRAQVNKVAAQLMPSDPPSEAPTDSVMPSADPTDDALSTDQDTAGASKCMAVDAALGPWYADPSDDTLQTALDDIDGEFDGDRSPVDPYGQQLILDLQVVLAEDQTLGTIPQPDEKKATDAFGALSIACSGVGYTMTLG
jgi:hypothetical protein